MSPMPSFKRKVATQIATVSLILATIASPIAWFVARENAEESIVKFAMEESQRLLRQDRSAAYTPSPQRGTNVCGI